MRQISILVNIFLIWTMVGMLSKVFFLLFYHTLISDAGWIDYCLVLWYGLKLDVAIAGYLCVLPGLMLMVSVWHLGRELTAVWKIYFAICAFACSLGYISNIGLYSYWGFPLDSTPLLYIKTAPMAALASMETWQLVVLPFFIVGLSVGIYSFFPVLDYRAAYDRRGGNNIIYGLRDAACCSLSVGKKIGYTLILLVFIALLIIPIRGGLDTGTNHTGNVYFSSDIRLNHAAVNPIFCFVESVTHHESISTRYRFMDNNDADRIFADLTYTCLRPDAKLHDYNVVLVCLESFSKYIMSEAGHVSGITPNLDRYSNEGIYFTNFYANSFRTDRALVSVLSGLPAQPTMSVMDLPRISTSLPSIARTLSKEGYNTHFYYGGDADYSNMRSYIIGTGFGGLTTQNNFPSRLITGKWGVADGPLFDRVMDDIKHAPDGKPFFKVIMTSSSHEPFDVPDYKKIDSPELNAFSYTDDCLGRFVDSLRRLPDWKNTLVFIVPDHLGGYPQRLDNYQLWRYEIPLFVLGGMVKPRQVPVVGSQIDISATLLAMLGRHHEDFVYSKDLLDAYAPHFAFFSVPDAIGMLEDNNFIYYDNIAQRAIVAEGKNSASLLPKVKAYLQKLYDYLGRF